MPRADRPCTSPRRNGCRSGTEWLGQSCTGEHPDPWNRARTGVPVIGGRWCWFQADLEALGRRVLVQK